MLVNFGADPHICKHQISSRGLKLMADPTPGAPTKVDLILSIKDVNRCRSSSDFTSSDQSMIFVQTFFEWTIGGTASAVEPQATTLKVSISSEES